LTLPIERTRAIQNAADFLLRLANPHVERGIKRVPLAVRREARLLLRHFPHAHDLEQAHEALPDTFGPPRDEGRDDG
jgi:hypothetical protein